MKNLILTMALLFGSAVFVFAKDNITYPKPVVVSFYGRNCEECKALSVIKDGAKDAFQDDIDFVEINFDEDDCDIDNLKSKYNVTKIPTTLFLNSKYKITKKNAGYIPPNVYLKQMEAIMLK